MYRIEIVNYKEHFTCPPDISILAAMVRQSKPWKARKPIKIGCRNGGCGICKIHILEGSYESGKMSGRQISEAERQAGYALACRIFPRSDMKIESDHYSTTQD